MRSTKAKARVLSEAAEYLDVLGKGMERSRSRRTKLPARAVTSGTGTAAHQLRTGYNGRLRKD